MIGMIGFRAQGMDARKASGRSIKTLVGIVDETASGASGSIVAPINCVATIYVFGPGGSSTTDSQSPNYGAGGGGAFAALQVPVSKGQAISYVLGVPGAAPTTVGNNATDSTVTLPDGRIIIAGGGKGGTATVGGAGGVASGGIINRAGGAGGANTSGNSASPGGGNGGLVGANVLSGGGAGAGFGENTVGLIGGNGGGQSTSGLPSAPGGGSGTFSGSPFKAGALGRVLIILSRLS